MKRTVIFLPMALAACASAPPPPLAIGSSTTAAAVASDLKPPPPVFIEDDYARALAEAKKKNLPLFIDAWASWCHTCLSMRAYVFTDAPIAARSKEFVWLSIDTEKAENAKTVERFPMQVWPTLWVVDPKTELPVLKWLGSATATELASLLDDAKASAANGDAGGEAGAALVRGNQASAAGRHDDAVREYRAALDAAPPRWAKRGHVVEALTEQLFAMKDDAACVTTAKAELPKLSPGTSLANTALTGFSCARRSPEGSPAREEAGVLARSMEQIALDMKQPILADDRSGLFEELVNYDMETSQPVKPLAAKWAAFLEGEAKRATSPSARAVFDAHRVLAYTALGEPARALPVLEASEKDFPNDYNPPARIASVDLVLKRYDDALAAADRALAKGYGPRKLRLYTIKADILEAKGDKEKLATTLRDAVRFGSALPENERNARQVDVLAKRLATVAP